MTVTIPAMVDRTIRIVVRRHRQRIDTMIGGMGAVGTMVPMEAIPGTDTDLHPHALVRMS